MSKILDKINLVETINREKELGKKIVFTNGCFDLFHYGHLQSLREAKSLGDILIVAINSDDSVKKLKGKKRPIISEKHRIELLSELECVNYVIAFNSHTPINVIHQIDPDVLFKGGDYSVNDIVGSQYVINQGGYIHIGYYHQKFSTSKIINKIRS
jgi:D-beta-D-heptose 7-phosphate kinase/D-beta-D-heptose 1-phosphate adenosyltransferase